MADIIDKIGKYFAEQEAQLRQVKPLLKRKSSTRKEKKKRSSTRPLRDEPSAEQLKRESEEKVTAALALAQERARRIRAERELALKNQELARREVQRRVQDEMDKIEAFRRKSKQFALRLRPQSAPSTPGAPSLGSVSTRSSPFSSSSDANDDASQRGIAESSSSGTKTTTEQAIEVLLERDETAVKQSGTTQAPSFLDTLERQLRDRLMLALQIREKTLTAQRTREQEVSRLRTQLAHQLARTGSTQQRVAALEATKASLTLELAKVDDERHVTRAHWRELDDASRKERAQRQREAEKQLRARVRTEEWRRLTDEEKARADVAADARVRAEQRVLSRAARLKKQLRSDLYELNQTRRNTNNSNSEDNDDGEDLTRILGLPASLTKAGKTTRAAAALLLPPELADFEEDGLLDDSRQLASSLPLVPAPDSSANGPRHSDAVESPQLQSQDHDTNSRVAVPRLQIDWHVPRFEDRALFDRLLRDAIPSP